MAECLFGHWGAYSWPIMGVKVHGIRLGSAWDPRGILWDPPTISWDPPFWVCAALWVFQENGASRTRASAPYIILKKETCLGQAAFVQCGRLCPTVACRWLSRVLPAVLLQGTVDMRSRILPLRCCSSSPHHARMYIHIHKDVHTYTHTLQHAQHTQTHILSGLLRYSFCTPAHHLLNAQLASDAIDRLRRRSHLAHGWRKRGRGPPHSSCR